MPFWLEIVWDVIKVLASGEFKNWWQEHKAKETQNDANKIESLSADAVSSELQHWKRPDK